MGADRHNVSVRMYGWEPEEMLRHLSADNSPLDGIDCAHVIGLKWRQCCVLPGKKGRERTWKSTPQCLSNRCVLSQRLSLRSTEDTKKAEAAFEQMKEKQQQQSFASK